MPNSASEPAACLETAIECCVCSADGGVFKGSWQAGKPVDGDGIRMRLPGCLTQYSGSIAGALYHGKGSAWYQNGDQYSGMWCHGAREGYGELVRADGGQFSGEWRADKPWEGAMLWQVCC